MRIFTIIVLMAFTLNATAQKSPLEKVINKYGDKKGVSTQLIEPGSEEFQSHLKIDGDEINEALSQLETIRIINVDSDKASLTTVNKFYGKAVDALEDERYSEIMKINSDDGEDVSFYISQHEDGALNEIVLLVNQEDGFMMVYVKGAIDMSDFNFGELMSVFTCINKDKDKDCEHSDTGGH